MNKSWIIILLAIVVTGASCGVDRVGLYGRFVGTYGKYDETIGSLSKYLQNNQNSLPPYEKSTYQLIIGLAYQHKNMLAESMVYYAKAIAASPKFNYWAELKKAEVYRLQNDRTEQIIYLKKALQSINELASAIKAETLSPQQVGWYGKVEFVLAYYVEKRDIAWCRQAYPEILRQRAVELTAIIDHKIHAD